MREMARRLAARLLRRRPSSALELGFGSWERLDSRTLAVCHPHWRGVRAAAVAFGDPLAECDDLVPVADEIIAGAMSSGVEVVVIHGYPSGTDALLTKAAAAGLRTRAVVHSSMAQHGAEAWEEAVVTRLLELSSEGAVGRVGFIKAGLAEAFTALGLPATHTPNRAPRLPAFERLDLEGKAPHLGVFAAPFWRKNVLTQLGAVAILGGTAHVMQAPRAGYLNGLSMVEHGELPWGDFVGLQASVDLNLYVTLSECHPMTPMESYLAGVPCLSSRTSDLFKSDRELWEVTTIDEADNPAAIADAARGLEGRRDWAVERARVWIRDADTAAEQKWAAFLAD